MFTEMPKQTNTRTQKALEQRLKLLETALALFAERGFEGTTIKELSERAGVSLGLMYHYFKNKESLLEAVVAEHSFVPRLKQTIGVGNTTVTLKESLYRTAIGFYDLLGQEKQLMQIFLREGRSNTAVRGVWRKTLAEGLSLIDAYLKEQVKKGVIQPHNTEVTARALFSTVLVMRITEETWPSTMTPQKIISELVDNLIKGLAR